VSYGKWIALHNIFLNILTKSTFAHVHIKAYHMLKIGLAIGFALGIWRADASNEIAC